MKYCSKCEIKEAHPKFVWCKDCRKVYDAEYYQRNKQRRLKQNKKWYSEFVLWTQTLKDNPCADCGGKFHTAAMQWDHLPQYEKTAHVSDLIGSGTKKA